MRDDLDITLDALLGAKPGGTLALRELVLWIKAMGLKPDRLTLEIRMAERGYILERPWDTGRIPLFKGVVMKAGVKEKIARARREKVISLGLRS